MRSWIRANGSTEFPPAKGRYHIYFSHACPWAHRTILLRSLKGLVGVISASCVDYFLDMDGWKFSPDSKETSDPIHNFNRLRQVYELHDPQYTGRYTVPVLFDKQTNKIVNNESSEIIQMLNSEFNEFCENKEQSELDLYPRDLQPKVDETNEWIYDSINNGVYKCGFATKQEPYEENFKKLFSALDKVESILAHSRYLTGNQITLADIRLFTTLVRFDKVYVVHFKCNGRRIVDYPNIWGFTREIYQLPGVKETVNFEHIAKHYYTSHKQINPTGIVPLGPLDLNFEEPHGRDKKYEAI